MARNMYTIHSVTQLLKVNCNQKQYFTAPLYSVEEKKEEKRKRKNGRAHGSVRYHVYTESIRVSQYNGLVLYIHTKHSKIKVVFFLSV